MNCCKNTCGPTSVAALSPSLNAVGYQWATSPNEVPLAFEKESLMGICVFASALEELI